MDRQRTNPFVEFLELLADLAILNVLFLLCCLPVVTAGASLAGLNYAAEKLRRQEGRAPSSRPGVTRRPMSRAVPVRGPAGCTVATAAAQAA